MDKNLTEKSAQENETANTEQANCKLRFWVTVNIVLMFLAIVLVGIAFKLANDGGDSFFGPDFKEQGLKPNSSGGSDALADPRRVLDGVVVRAGEENPIPTAVMIDNHTDARPPAGLEKASLVYEAEAEGGITRYMAVFADLSGLNMIGPVRSARSYFVEWADELSAVYVHVGGSPAALAQIAKENIVDVNEFYKGDYFWREKRYAAPHNVFSSGSLLDSYLETRSHASGTYIGWTFAPEIPLSERPATSTIEIAYRVRGYEVSWEYYPDENIYKRKLGGREHLTFDGNIISAKNVVIQTIIAEEIDDYLRLDMDTTGSGDAVVCVNGSCSLGKWEKRNRSSRTRFYTSDGQEAVFVAGTTWIEVVRPEIKVAY